MPTCRYYCHGAMLKWQPALANKPCSRLSLLITYPVERDRLDIFCPSSNRLTWNRRRCTPVTVMMSAADWRPWACSWALQLARGYVTAKAPG
jgi:hypothetical protein